MHGKWELLINNNFVKAAVTFYLLLLWSYNEWPFPFVKLLITFFSNCTVLFILLTSLSSQSLPLRIYGNGECTNTDKGNLVRVLFSFFPLYIFWIFSEFATTLKHFYLCCSLSGSWNQILHQPRIWLLTTSSL